MLDIPVYMLGDVITLFLLSRKPGILGEIVLVKFGTGAVLFWGPKFQS
jgi:hypothetical protein